MNTTDPLLNCEILCSMILDGVCVCVCVCVCVHRDCVEQLLCQLVDRQIAVQGSRLACRATLGTADSLPPQGQ